MTAVKGRLGRQEAECKKMSNGNIEDGDAGGLELLGVCDFGLRTASVRALDQLSWTPNNVSAPSPLHPQKTTRKEFNTFEELSKNL